MVINSESHSKEIKKGLYLVSTPIGNLSDITYRAVEILKKSDYILCEDTRVSKKLFERYGIKRPILIFSSAFKFIENDRKKNVTSILIILIKLFILMIL